jgi:putative aminopeptidase FrvX
MFWRRTQEIRSVFELVKELTELPGPTGHEDAVQDHIASRWAGFARDVRRTKVNKVLAFVGGSAPRPVQDTHADEICLMIKSVTDEGFLHLWPFYSGQLGRPPRWFTPVNQPALAVTSSGTVEGVLPRPVAMLSAEGTVRKSGSSGTIGLLT